MGKKRLFVSLLIIVLCFVFVTGCTDKLDFEKNEFVNDGDSSEQKMQAEGEQTEEYPIIDVLTHKNGLAWVNYYNTEGIEKFALVDEKGNEIYTIPEDNIKNPRYIKASEKGLSCYAYYTDEERVHNLVNSKGEVVASSATGEFDSIIGCGLEYALVYKHEAGLYSSEKMIATLDQNGNIVHDYIPLAIQPSMNADRPLARYLGDGLFLIDLSLDNWLYYDCVNGTATYFMTSAYNDPFMFSYYDGYLFIKDNSNETEIYKYTDMNNLESLELYRGDHALFRDGTFYTLGGEEFDYISDGYLIKRDGWDYNVYNPINEKKFKVESPIDDETHLLFEDDYGYLSMTGKDHKSYSTVVDNDGKMLFEPIRGGVKIYEDYVIYGDEENENLYHVTDLSGNHIAELNASKIIEFENGKVVCVDPETGGNRLMDINGNVLFDTIVLK